MHLLLTHQPHPPPASATAAPAARPSAPSSASSAALCSTYEGATAPPYGPPKTMASPQSTASKSPPTDTSLALSSPLTPLVNRKSKIVNHQTTKDRRTEFPLPRVCYKHGFRVPSERDPNKSCCPGLGFDVGDSLISYITRSLSSVLNGFADFGVHLRILVDGG